MLAGTVVVVVVGAGLVAEVVVVVMVVVVGGIPTPSLLQVGLQTGMLYVTEDDVCHVTRQSPDFPFTHSRAITSAGLRIE